MLVLRVRSIVAAFLVIAALAACDTPGSDGAQGGAGGATVSSSHASSTHGAGPKAASTGTDGGGGAGGEPQTPTAVVDATHLTTTRGATFQLSGIQSSSPSGDLLTYEWAQISGAAVDIPDFHQPYQALVAPDVVGPLVFELVVFDGPLISQPVDVTVDVVDLPPVANAGPDRGALGGDVVTLLGAGTDPEGDPLGYAWTQVSGSPIALDDPTAASPTFTMPPDLSGPAVFALVVNDGHLDSEVDWVTVRRLTGPDTDGDLLEDALEASLGTDPANADTDADGIPDGWEVLGHEDVDYAALGCDPRHRDILVELHIQQYTGNDGAFHSASPSPTVRASLAAFYAGLEIPNPDGVNGIALHLVDDTPLDGNFVCPDLVFRPNLGETEPRNFLYREAFHKADVCLGGGQSSAEIGGRQLYLLFSKQDADPDNDLVEANAFYAYSIFLHEMGHNLSLHHGGADDTNYKPNYPSVMNYTFLEGFGNAPSIQDSTVTLSRGLMPDLDECALVESEVFAGVAPEDVAYLSSYTPMGWTVAADGSVDWDFDGAIAPAPYQHVLRNGADPNDCQLLHDQNDVAVIAAKMANSLPSNPNAPVTFELGGLPPPHLVVP